MIIREWLFTGLILSCTQSIIDVNVKVYGLFTECDVCGRDVIIFELF